MLGDWVVYMDWEEALGTALGAVARADGDLDYHGWAALWSALDGRMADAGWHAARSGEPATGMFHRGVVTTVEWVGELVAHRPEPFDQLWSAVAACRAGGSWLAHLHTAASSESGRRVWADHPTVRDLLADHTGLALRRVVGSWRLDAHWAGQPDDPGEVGDVDVLAARLEPSLPEMVRDRRTRERAGFAWAAHGPSAVDTVCANGDVVAGDAVAEAALAAAATASLQPVALAARPRSAALSRACRRGGRERGSRGREQEEPPDP